jgi:hypothetical protein
MSQELPPQINTSGSKTKSEGMLAGLSKSAGAASKIVAMQAEKTKLNTLTLPAAYRALGKDCLQQKRHLECASELTTQLRSVLAEIKQLSEVATAQPAPRSFTDKAKAAGNHAFDVARTKQLGMKRDTLIANIGKAIYNTHADQSGPVELVTPICYALARVSEIEAEIGQQSQVGKGTFVTPKRMLIAAAVAVVVVFAVVGSKGVGDAAFRRELAGESGSYTQRVLDLTAEQKKEYGVSVPKAARPLFAPGSTEDLIQALTMFKVDGDIASFNNHIILGDGSRAWGDSDSINGIEQNCKIQFGGGIYMKTKCWDDIYGPQHDLATANETVLYGGTISPGKMLVDRWLATCTDSTVLVRGPNRNSPSGMYTKSDEILVMFVHFDEPYPSIFPPADPSGGSVHFDY